MKSDSLVHDHACAIAAAILEVFNLRDEEKRDAFAEVYVRVQAGLVHYEEKAERMHRRIHPSRN